MCSLVETGSQCWLIPCYVSVLQLPVNWMEAWISSHCRNQKFQISICFKYLAFDLQKKSNNRIDMALIQASGLYLCPLTTYLKTSALQTLSGTLYGFETKTTTDWEAMMKELWNDGNIINIFFSGQVKAAEKPRDISLHLSADSFNLISEQLIQSDGIVCSKYWAVELLSSCCLSQGNKNGTNQPIIPPRSLHCSWNDVLPPKMGPS